MWFRKRGKYKGYTSDSTEETKNEAAATAGKKDASEKLVVWTLADDLKQFAERYCEKYPDLQIETVTIAPADYPTKIQTAMRGKQTTPDIIVGEPQMLEDMYEADISRIWIRSLTMPRTMQIRS